MKLHFPKTDNRSSGESFNGNRPWLKEGAKCETVPSRFRRQYTTLVHFVDAPPKEFDLVSPEFLRG